MRITSVVAIAALLAACSSDIAGQTTTPATGEQTAETSTAPTTPATTTTTKTTSPATTTTIGFSDDSRLAVGRCNGSFDENFAQGVAVESISKTTSPKLSDAHTLCIQAESLLRAANAPDGSPVAHMLDATLKVNAALTNAAHQIAGGHLLDPPCPNGASCNDTVLALAVIDYGKAVLLYAPGTPTTTEPASVAALKACRDTVPVDLPTKAEQDPTVLQAAIDACNAAKDAMGDLPEPGASDAGFAVLKFTIELDKAHLELQGAGDGYDDIAKTEFLTAVLNFLTAAHAYLGG